MLKSPPRLEDTDKEDTLERRIRTAANVLRRTFSPIYGGYTSRFFVVDDSEMRYYKDEQMRTLAGTIDIATVSEVRPAERTDAPPFSIDLVTDARVFTIAPNPPNPEVALTWLGVLASKVETARKRGMFSRSLKHSGSRGKLQKPSSRQGSRRQLTQQALTRSKSASLASAVPDNKAPSLRDDRNLHFGSFSSLSPLADQDTVPFFSQENPGYSTFIDFSELFPLVTPELLTYYDASFLQVGLPPLFSTSNTPAPDPSALSTHLHHTHSAPSMYPPVTDLPTSANPSATSIQAVDTLFNPAGRAGNDAASPLYRTSAALEDGSVQAHERAFLAGGKGWVSTVQHAKKKIRALPNIRNEFAALTPHTNPSPGAAPGTAPSAAVSLHTTPAIPGSPAPPAAPPAAAPSSPGSPSLPKRVRDFFSAAGVLTSRRTKTSIPLHLLGLPLLAPLYLSHETCRFASDAPIDVGLRELPLTLAAAGAGGSSMLLRRWLSRAPRAWIHLLQGHSPAEWLGACELGVGGEDLGVKWTAVAYPEAKDAIGTLDKAEGASGNPHVGIGDASSEEKLQLKPKLVDFSTLETSKTYPLPTNTTSGALGMMGMDSTLPAGVYPLAPKAQFLRNVLYPLFSPVVSQSYSSSSAPMRTSSMEFDKVLLTEMSTWDVRLDFLGNVFASQSANSNTPTTAASSSLPFQQFESPVNLHSLPSLPNQLPGQLPGAPLLALLHLLLFDALSTTDIPGIGGVPPSTQTTLWNSLLRQGGYNQTHTAAGDATSPTSTSATNGNASSVQHAAAAPGIPPRPEQSASGAPLSSRAADAGDDNAPAGNAYGTTVAADLGNGLGATNAQTTAVPGTTPKKTLRSKESVAGAKEKQKPAVLHSRRRGSSVFVTPDVFAPSPHSYIHAAQTLTPSQKEMLFAHSNATQNMRQCYDTQLSKLGRIAVQPFYVDSQEYSHTSLTVGDAWEYQTVVDALATKTVADSTTTSSNSSVSNADSIGPLRSHAYSPYPPSQLHTGRDAHSTLSSGHSTPSATPVPSSPLPHLVPQPPSDQGSTDPPVRSVPRVSFAESVSVASAELAPGAVHNPSGAASAPSSSNANSLAALAKKRKSTRYLVLSPPNASFSTFAGQYSTQNAASSAAGGLATSAPTRRYQLRRRLEARPLNTLLPRRRTRHISRWEEVSGNTPRWSLSVLDAQYLKHTPAFASLLGIGPGQGVPHKRPAYLPHLPKEVYPGTSPLDLWAVAGGAAGGGHGHGHGHGPFGAAAGPGGALADARGDKDGEGEYLYNGMWGDKEEMLLYRQVQEENLVGLWSRRGGGKGGKKKEPKNVTHVEDVHTIGAADSENEEEEEEEEEEDGEDGTDVPDLDIDGLETNSSMLSHSADAKRNFPYSKPLNDHMPPGPSTPGPFTPSSGPCALSSLFLKAFHPDSVPMHLSFLSPQEIQQRVHRTLFPSGTPKWILALRTLHYLHSYTSAGAATGGGHAAPTSPFTALAQAHYRLTHPSPFRPDKLSGLGLRGLEENLRRALSPLEKCHLGNILVSTATEQTLHLLPPVLLLHLLSRRLSVPPPAAGTRGAEAIAGSGGSSGRGKPGTSAIDFFASATMEDDPTTALYGHLDAILLSQHSVIRPLVHEATTSYRTSVVSPQLSAIEDIAERNPLSALSNTKVTAATLNTTVAATSAPPTSTATVPTVPTAPCSISIPSSSSHSAETPKVLPSSRSQRVATLRWLVAQRVAGVLMDPVLMKKAESMDSEKDTDANAAGNIGKEIGDNASRKNSILESNSGPSTAVTLDMENMASDKSMNGSAVTACSSIIKSNPNPSTVAYLLRPEELHVFLRAAESVRRPSNSSAPLVNDASGGLASALDAKSSQSTTLETLQALEAYTAKQSKQVFRSPTCQYPAASQQQQALQQAHNSTQQQHYQQNHAQAVPSSPATSLSPTRPGTPVLAATPPVYPGSSINVHTVGGATSTALVPAQGATAYTQRYGDHSEYASDDMAHMHAPTAAVGTTMPSSAANALGPHGIPVHNHAEVFTDTLPRHAVAIHGSHYGLAYEASGSTPPMLLAKALRIYVTEFLAQEDNTSPVQEGSHSGAPSIPCANGYITELSFSAPHSDSAVAPAVPDTEAKTDIEGQDVATEQTDEPAPTKVAHATNNASEPAMSEEISSQGSTTSTELTVHSRVDFEATMESSVPTSEASSNASKDTMSQKPPSYTRKLPSLFCLPNTFEDPIILHGRPSSYLLHPSTHTHGITEMLPKVVPTVTTVTTVVTTVTTQIHPSDGRPALPPAHHHHHPSTPDTDISVTGPAIGNVTSSSANSMALVPGIGTAGSVGGYAHTGAMNGYADANRHLALTQATHDCGNNANGIAVGDNTGKALVLIGGDATNTSTSVDTAVTNYKKVTTSNDNAITTTTTHTTTSTSIVTAGENIVPTDGSFASLPLSSLLSAAGSVETRTTTVTTTTSTTVAERSPWANTHTPYSTSYTVDQTPPPLPLPRLSSIVEASPFASALLAQTDLLLDPYELALAHCKLHVLPPNTTLYRATHPYGATKLSRYADVETPFTQNESILIVLSGSLRHHYLPPPEILAKIGSRAWRLLRQQLLMSRFLSNLVTRKPMAVEDTPLPPNPADLDPVALPIDGAVAVPDAGLPGRDSGTKSAGTAGAGASVAGAAYTASETVASAMLPRVTFTKHPEDRSLVLTQYNIPAPVMLGVKQLLHNEAIDSTVTTASGCIALEIDRHALRRLKHNLPTLYRHVRLMASFPPPHVLVGAIPSLASVFYDPSPSSPPGLDRLPLMHAIAQAFKPILLSPGERLFSEDDHADCAYVVVSGCIAMTVLPGVGSIAEEEVLLQSERLLAAKAAEKRSGSVNLTPDSSIHSADSSQCSTRILQAAHGDRVNQHGISVAEQKLHLARRDEFRVTVATFGPYSCVGESGLFTRTIYKGRRAMLTTPGIDVTGANENVQVTNNLRGYTATATCSTIVLRISRVTLYSILGSTFMLSSRPRIWRHFYEALECRDASTLQRLHSLSSITGTTLSDKYLSPLSDLFHFMVLRAPHTPTFPLVPSSFEVSDKSAFNPTTDTTPSRTLPSPYPVTYKMEDNLKQHQTVFPLNDLPETTPTTTTSAIVANPLRSLLICLRGAVSVESVKGYMRSVNHVRAAAYASAEASTRNLMQNMRLAASNANADSVSSSGGSARGEFNAYTSNTNTNTPFKPKKLEKVSIQPEDLNPYYKLYNSGDWIGATLPVATSKTGFLVHKEASNTPFSCIHSKESTPEDLSEEPLLLLACSSPTARYLKELSKDSCAAEMTTSRALAQKIKENPSSAPTLDTPVTMLMTGASTSTTSTVAASASAVPNTMGTHSPETTSVAEIPTLCSDVCTHSAALLYVPPSALYTFLSTLPNSSHNFKSHLRICAVTTPAKDYVPVVPKSRGALRDTRNYNVFQVPHFDPAKYSVNTQSITSPLQSGSGKQPKIFSTMKRLLLKKGKLESLPPPDRLTSKERRQSFYFGDSTAVKKFTFRSLLPNDESAEAGRGGPTSYGKGENIIIYEQTRIPPGTRPPNSTSGKGGQGKPPPPPTTGGTKQSSMHDQEAGIDEVVL